MVNYLVSMSTFVALSGLVISLVLVELLAISKKPVSVGSRAR